MYKLGCYVSENDILSALAVMIVYFAIHQIILNIWLCATTLHTRRKTENSEPNQLAEGVLRDSGILSSYPGITQSHGPCYSFLPLGPVEEGRKGFLFPTVEFHEGKRHSH